MEDRIWFGKLHIIEWLRPNDRRTGRELWNEVEPMEIVSKPPIDVAYYSIATRADFIAVLDRIAADFRATGRLPLLQIETHGHDEHGIGVSNTEGLSWPELMATLIPLNQMTGVRLVVVLASCWGIWGIKMAQPVGRAAFLALIGPNRQMDEDEIAPAMQAFYRSLFRDQSFNHAIQAMNDVVDPTRATFGAFHAETLFTDVYDGYLESTSTEADVVNRVDGWVARARAESGDLSPEEIWQIRAFARDYILNYHERFEERRRYFFMIDLFPENDARFNLTLQLQT